MIACLYIINKTSIIVLPPKYENHGFRKSILWLLYEFYDFMLIIFYIFFQFLQGKNSHLWVKVRLFSHWRRIFVPPMLTGNLQKKSQELRHLIDNFCKYIPSFVGVLICFKFKSRIYIKQQYKNSM